MEYATFRKWLTERGRYGFCEPGTSICNSSVRDEAPGPNVLAHEARAHAH